MVVASCDKYSDVWDLFFTLFWKYWPDCPYPVYLGANRLSYPHFQVTTLLTGGDSSWGGNIRRVVDQIQSPYLMLFLDDHFLLRPVRTERIEYHVGALHGLQGGYLRLDPNPPPDNPVAGFPTIGEIEPGAPYRCSLHVSIWRKDVLLTLLRDGETAWDMEFKGSGRSSSLRSGFYATWKSILRYDSEGIVRGKWTIAALRLAQREGISVDLSRRQTLTWEETTARRLRQARTKLFNLLPWRIRRQILKIRLDRFFSTTA